jgi:hypothetical protein
VLMYSRCGLNCRRAIRRRHTFRSGCGCPSAHRTTYVVLGAPSSWSFTNIGGKTLAPGLYKWTSTVTIPADVVLSGGANDVWIFQTSGDLTMDASKQVLLSGGAQAKNVFWQVAGKATFGAGSHFEGIVLAKTDITLVTNTTMNGRALSQTQVVLQQATITKP